MGIQNGLMALINKRHYLLVVAPTDCFAANNIRVYERVGAGYLPGRCLLDNLVPASIEWGAFIFLSIKSSSKIYYATTVLRYGFYILSTL